MPCWGSVLQPGRGLLSAALAWFTLTMHWLGTPPYYLFIYLSIDLFIFLFIYLFVHLPLSVVLFGCFRELLLSQSIGRVGLGLGSLLCFHRR